MTRQAHHQQTQVTDTNPQVPGLLAKMFAAEVDPDTGCWNWTYAIQHGYGRVGVKDHTGVRRMLMAHRVSFELFRHPIAEDHQVDHLCVNRACVNPDHLEAVTQQENILRQREAKYGPYETRQCKRGHDLADAYVTPRGTRQCVQCKNDVARAKYQGRAA